MDVAVALVFFHPLEETEASMSKALEKQLTAQQLARVQSDFRRYDANADGILTVAEFRKAMEPFLTPEDLKKLLKELDPDGNGRISWKSFLADYINDLSADN
ncbi:EF-hand domain-containing protein [Pseudomonas palleroniana]